MHNLDYNMKTLVVSRFDCSVGRTVQLHLIQDFVVAKFAT